jgi:hypothetical protein
MKSDLNSNNQPTRIKHNLPHENTQALFIRNQSNALFNKVRMIGCVRRFFTCLFQKSWELFSLSSLTQIDHTTNSCEVGLRSIPLNMIIGSENRCKDFDNHFVPLSELNHHRWMRISDMFLKDEPFPVIELIQIGKYYFVRDGHHRISVAKALGKKYLDAHVTVLQLQGDTLAKIEKKTANRKFEMAHSL